MKAIHEFTEFMREEPKATELLTTLSPRLLEYKPGIGFHPDPVPSELGSHSEALLWVLIYLKDHWSEVVEAAMEIRDRRMKRLQLQALHAGHHRLASIAAAETTNLKKEE